jgi:hypothetical protein
MLLAETRFLREQERVWAFDRYVILSPTIEELVEN